MGENLQGLNRTTAIGLAALASVVASASSGSARAAPASPPRSPSACATPRPAAAASATPALTEVVFDGARALSANQLRGVWAACIGQPVGVADLKIVARSVEIAYARLGYPFVAVLLPSQEITGGVVHFQVLEGKITSITYLGVDTAARRQAAAVFSQLRDRQPASTADLDEAFQRSKQVPGLTAVGSLGPANTPGGMELVVKATRQEWTSYANINNDYPKALGTWAIAVGGERDGDSVYGDQLSGQLSASPDLERQLNGKLGYVRGINAVGTSLGGSILVSQAKPAGGFSSLSLTTKALNARFEADQAILSRTSANVIGAVGLEWNDQSTNVFSSSTVGEDRLRVLSLRLSGSMTSRLGVGSWQAEARQGLTWADASRAGAAMLSRPGGDPQATVYRASGTFDTVPWKGFTATARVQSQYANHPLLVGEQFSIGNLAIVKGFEPGALLADRAVAGGIELRAPTIALRGYRFSAFAFTEGARLQLLGDAAATNWAQSLGGGLRMDFPNHMRLETAYAAGHGPASVGSPSRLLINVTSDLSGLGPFVSSALRHLNRTAP